MESFNHNDEESLYFFLILQKMEKTISDEDDLKLQVWRELNPNNNSLYKEIMKTDDALTLLKVYQELQVNQSLENLHHKLNISTKLRSENYQQKIRTVSLRKWIAIAASLSIIFLSIFFFYVSNDLVTLKTNELSTKNVKLPDGSTIFLNVNTEVSYSKSKFATTRALKLTKGECFLNIIHHPNKIFYISYKDVKVIDIGTSFSFKVYKDKVTINVQTGEVKLKIKNKPVSTNVKAGEYVSYFLNNQKIIKKTNDDLNFKAFVDHHLYFNDSYLPEIAKTLEEIYHKKIIIRNKALMAKKLTAEFNNQTFDDILMVITNTLNIKAQNINGRIYLD